MTTYPAWAAGSRITAAKLNYGITQELLAASAQAVNNSTTMVDDTELLFAAEANANYDVEFFMLFEAGVNCDVRTEWAVPSGSSGLKHCLGATLTAGSFTSRDDARMRVGGHGYTTDIVYQLDTGTLAQLCIERSTVQVGSTTGNIGIRFAQGTATVGDMTRMAGSYMRWKRVA